MKELGLVHLVRQENGIEPFGNFIASYKDHPCGIEHELIIVFKGFAERKGPDEYQALLEGVAYKPLFVPDEGFDIGPYFIAAREFEHKYFCFLNSFSVILDDRWLAKMYNHIRQPGVGLVGATGSSESMYTNLFRVWKHYRPDNHMGRRARDEMRRVRLVLEHRLHFSPFPNYHVRTNAFLISRDLMLKLRHASFENKREVERFESGRNSMTRQILAAGLKTLVVGRDGLAYDREQWYASRTFRSGAQQNLLVADNRTRQYEEADAQLKTVLVEYAWGAPVESRLERLA